MPNRKAKVFPLLHDDPYNWAPWRKVTIGVIFSFGQLVTLMTASMIAAALGDISNDLGIDAATAQIVFATYFLGLAFGPFVIAAFAEVYGRKWVWVAGNLWYILWNGISPVGNSKDLMIVGRLMTGFGASAGVTLTGPTMADMYGKKDRGKAVAISSLLPFLGPALGPILGGIVTQMIEWQWIFWIMCAFNGLTTLIGVLCIRESYTPVLLHRKARKHREDAGINIEPPSLKASMNVLGASLWRPVRLLLRRPFVQIIGLILALDFAIYSLILGTFADLYISKYGQSQSISSLHYIAIALGATSAAQVGGRLMDWSYRRMTARYGGGDGTGKPEFRVPYLVPGVIITPLGLFLYGWAAEHVVSWPVVDVGATIFNFGSFMASQMLYAYQLDEFVEHAASAGAATRVLSYTLGFAFPIFAPDLYERLGYGWGNSMLAFLWVVFCFPLPVLLWLWGDKLRAMGRGSKEGLVDGA
ncbi:major facilitator superfamily domain-containing protein [Diaporthe sp. PMI_573]|nr:major facilitator superfamily domain-containing protein [Diaporthaceae sp. PMI_573]